MGMFIMHRNNSSDSDSSSGDENSPKASKQRMNLELNEDLESKTEVRKPLSPRNHRRPQSLRRSLSASHVDCPMPIPSVSPVIHGSESSAGSTTQHSPIHDSVVSELQYIADQNELRQSPFRPIHTPGSRAVDVDSEGENESPVKRKSSTDVSIRGTPVTKRRRMIAGRQGVRSRSPSRHNHKRSLNLRRLALAQSYDKQHRSTSPSSQNLSDCMTPSPLSLSSLGQHLQTTQISRLLSRIDEFNQLLFDDSIFESMSKKDLV